MLGGCLLMFVQLPVFMGLYRGLSADIALRGQPLIPGLHWCSNLAGPDQLLKWQSWMPFGLGEQTGLLGPYLNILPLLTIVLFVLQTKLFSPPATDDQQKTMQRVMTIMMCFMGILFFKVPAGLCIYFITSSIWGIVERKLIPKPVIPESLAALDPEKKMPDAKKKLVTTPEPLPSNDKAREDRRRADRERQRRLRQSQE